MKQMLLKQIPTLIGILFVYSGILKLLHPAEAQYAIESLEVGHSLARGIITAVTIVELYLGVILIFKIDLRYAMIVATALVFAFAVFLFYLSTLAHPPKCGCLGLTRFFESNKAEALLGLFRNCVILWSLKLSYAHLFGEPLNPSNPQTGTVPPAISD